MLLALVFLLTAAGLHPSRADIQNPPGRGRGPNARRTGRNEPVATAASRPASAAGVSSVEVPLGGSVDIPLRASGQLGKSIDFLLREPPAHGTLGEVRPTGRDSAVITYTHRAEDGPATDSFAYAVQAPGTAVSAPAVVEVRVLDDPPRLAIVGEDGGSGAADLDFGDVPVGGGGARRELWVENRGGGVAVGTLEPPAPWVVEGAAGYRLGRDERQGFTLVFRPGVARSYTGRVVVGRGGAGSSAQLSGAGLRPDGTRPPPAGTAEESATPAVALLIPPPGRGATAVPGLARVEVTPPPGAGSAPPPPTLGPTGSTPPPTVSGGPPSAGAAYAPLLAGAQREEAPVKHLVIQEIGKHTMTVAWPMPKPAPVAYRVERRRVWMENGELQTEWDSHENVAYTSEPDGTVHALLRGLVANEQQTVRVLAVDGRGTLSAPSAQIVTATLPDPHWWQRITLLKALLAGLAVCLVLIWRRRRTYGTGW